MNVSKVVDSSILSKGILRDVLSAWEETTRLGHCVANLSLCAELECHGRDAEHDEAHDGRIGLPVGGLSVPATGR